MSRIPLLSLRLPPDSGGQTGYKPNVTLRDFELLDPSNPPTSSSLCLLSRIRCQLKPKKASTVSMLKQTFTHTCVPGHRSTTRRSSRQQLLNNSAVGWVLLERKMTSIENLEQACGDSFRVFCCSNVFVIGSSTTPKEEKRNRFTQCPETIFTITLDWLGVALKCLEAVCSQSDARNALNILSQSGMTLEFRSMTSQTPSKVAQCTQPTSVPALLLCGLSFLAGGSLGRVTLVRSGLAV